MELIYDPGENDRFWNEISQLPGFPTDDKISLEKMIFESDALFAIPSILLESGLEQGESVLLVIDPTPMRRGKDSLKPLVIKVLEQAGYQVIQLILEPDESGQVHTDMDHIEIVKRQLKKNLTVISVGSGVVTDITKHACYLYEQEKNESIFFIVFQTANSVSAYTSDMAPVFVQGVKRTLASRYPNILICDLETLVDAPLEMTVAGVGDLLAAFVSFPDWYIAYHLGMDEHYTTLPQYLMGDLDQIFLEYAIDIRKPTLKGMEVLAKLISLGGLAMSLSHATTPMSGYEHVISHVLDMIQEHQKEELTQHGSQVSLAAVMASLSYQDFLRDFDPIRVNINTIFPSKQMMNKNVKDAFIQVDPSGKAGNECWSDYEQKLDKWAKNSDQIKNFLKNWAEHKKKIEPLTRTPKRILDVLTTIDAPLRFRDLVPSIKSEDAHFAFFNAPLMRKRLTLGDLLIFFDWDRDSLWQEITKLGVL